MVWQGVYAAEQPCGAHEIPHWDQATQVSHLWTPVQPAMPSDGAHACSRQTWRLLTSRPHIHIVTHYNSCLLLVSITGRTASGGFTRIWSVCHFVWTCGKSFVAFVKERVCSCACWSPYGATLTDFVLQSFLLLWVLSHTHIFLFFWTAYTDKDTCLLVVVIDMWVRAHIYLTCCFWLLIK